MSEVNYYSNNKEQDRKKREEFVNERVLRSRKIILSEAVTNKLADRVIRELLFLESDNPKKDIILFINSPGGEIFSGFAVFDMIKFIKPKVRTLVAGMAASMGSILSLAAPKGQRFALPLARILIHQPLLSGSYFGVASDIEIQAREMLKAKEKIIEIYMQATGKNHKEIEHDIDRDFWMTAEEAKKYGLIDKIIKSSSELPQ